MKKTFPCPFCARLGEPSVEPGDTVDVGDDKVGSAMMQIGPDCSCGGCDGEGDIEVGSKKHFRIKCNSAYQAINKIFGVNTIEALPEKEYKQFWGNIDFGLLEEVWLKQNKQGEPR